MEQQLRVPHNSSGDSEMSSWHAMRGSKCAKEKCPQSNLLGPHSQQQQRMSSSCCCSAFEREKERETLLTLLNGYILFSDIIFDQDSWGETLPRAGDSLLLLGKHSMLSYTNCVIIPSRILTAKFSSLTKSRCRS